MPNKALAEKLRRDGEGSVWNPPGVPFELNGRTYAIRPMNDAQLIEVTKSLNIILNVLDLVRGASASGVSNFDVALLVGDLFASALPEVSRCVATALGVPVEEIAEHCPLHKKVEALTLQLESENLDILLGFTRRLAAMMRKPETHQPTSSSSPSSDSDSKSTRSGTDSNSDAPPSTNSSPTPTDSA